MALSWGLAQLGDTAGGLQGALDHTGIPWDGDSVSPAQCAITSCLCWGPVSPSSDCPLSPQTRAPTWWRTPTARPSQ